MGFAGADDAFELGVREQAGAEDALRQVRAVARLRRCDRGHRGGLDQTGRVRACAGDAQALERVAFVQALAQATDLSGRSLAGLVDEFDNGRRGCARDGRLDGVKAGRDPRTDTGQAAGTAGGDGRGGEARGGGQRWARGNVAFDQGQQLRDVRGDAVAARKPARVLGRDAIDDGEPRFRCGAVASVGATVERRREHHPPALLQARERFAARRAVGGKARARDGDQPPTLGQAGQRRGDMLQRPARNPALDARGHRERRVHQHHARPNPGREVVVDLFGVVPRDRRRREQPFEETGARRGELIQRQGSAREFGEDRQQPGPGRGLEHDVGGRQPRRDARHETERQRG